MSAVERLARTGVAVAARRWPRDLSETMRQTWEAELDALHGDRTLGPLTRSRRALTFSASLLLSAPVEAADAEPRTWRQYATWPSRAATALSAAAGVTLLTAALFNLVHVASYGLARPASATARLAAEIGLLLLASTVSWFVGAAVAQRGPVPLPHRPVVAAITCTVPVGGGMCAFLLAGNRVAVMPFMGWRDVLPGVGAWTVLTTVAIGLARHAAAHGRRRLAVLAAAGGSLVALEAATFFGSLHAAATTGLRVGSAPAWFPLTLLPGGTLSFGRIVADPAASLVGPGRSGPAVHASDVLLGNASAMVGPLLLCSALLMAYTMRLGPGRVGARRLRVEARRLRSASVGLGLAAVATSAYLAAYAFHPAAVLARLVDNSAVFGFGFVCQPAGRIGLAAVMGILVAWFTRRTDVRA